MRRIFRLIYILFICYKYSLISLIAWRYTRFVDPMYWLKNKHINRGKRLRKALEALGPIFIKFGQILSVRQDLLPPDITTELANLQDNVAPFSGELAVKKLTRIYKKPLSDIFAEFSKDPLASASIAQVHAARLFSGQDVVVKLLRPGIKKIIKRDVSLLYSLAAIFELLLSNGKLLKPREVVKEFERSILDELDLQREAANASLLRRHFQHSTLLYVPEIYWPYSTSKVLVMERIYGIAVSDIETLKAKNINLNKLAKRGVEIFCKQVFEDNFFHADMHPGNIFVDPNQGDDPRYIAIDFGIIGSLDENDQRYLAENLYAFFQRDYKRVAQLHVESGWVGPNTKVIEFESAIRTVCEPIFDKPLQDISMGMLLLYLFQIAGRFHMEVQPQLLLLQKTILNIESLGKQIDANLNLWDTAGPFVESWLKKRVSPKMLWQQMKKEASFISHHLPSLPRLLQQNLTQKTIKPKQKTKSWALVGMALGNIMLLQLTLPISALMLFNGGILLTALLVKK